MTKARVGSGVGLVWNKGIAALCDRRIPDEFANGSYATVPMLAGAMASSKLPSNLICNPRAYADIRNGELIWVRVSWLKSFVEQVLPLVDARFVLVTGDSDSCVPSELNSVARTILQSPKVVHWFTQDFDGTVAGKISPLPIGIDFHMQSEKPIWNESISSPGEQEETLLSIGAQLSPREDRIPQVYVDFAWQKGFGLRHYRRYHRLVGTRFRESRRTIARKLRGNASVFLQQGPIPRSEMWRERGKYAFVLSPHGMGLDCHRTWEALALGHIVLLPTSALDPLYDGLPVVTLKSWGDIAPKNLQKWLLQFRSNVGPHRELSSQYWIEKMRVAANQ